MTAPEVSAIILAGGKSSRLGCDKAFLPVGGQTLIERAFGELSQVFGEILISTNAPAGLDGLGAAALVPDIVKDIGPLGGIHAGLEAMTNEYGFFVACDMPALDARVIRSQLDVLRSAPADAVVPRWEGRVEPLHALYGKSCLPAVRSCIESGIHRIIEFYDAVRLRYWDLAPTRDWSAYFHNVNTPEEWRAISGSEQG